LVLKHGPVAEQLRKHVIAELGQPPSLKPDRNGRI
jgi:hypothetical protein